MACLSRASGRHAEFVRDHFVLDVFSGQVFLERGSNGHDVTPVQYTQTVHRNDFLQAFAVRWAAA
jgi:hypothetical protein